jgi:hypothetical protein
MSRDIDNQSPTDNDDDSDDMSNKKPLHLLQIPVHPHHVVPTPGRYSPQESSLHHQFKGGISSPPSAGHGGSMSHGFNPQQNYRNTLHSPPPPTLSQRYLHPNSQHDLMTSSISAWSEQSMHHTQQHRSLQQPNPSDSHLNYSSGTAYMMASPDMTSSYSSTWFPSHHHPSIDQQQHLSSLLS